MSISRKQESEAELGLEPMWDVGLTGSCLMAATAAYPQLSIAISMNPGKVTESKAGSVDGEAVEMCGSLTASSNS